MLKYLTLSIIVAVSLVTPTLSVAQNNEEVTADLV